jgi:hypothetical protein
MIERLKALRNTTLNAMEKAASEHNLDRMENWLNLFQRFDVEICCLEAKEAKKAKPKPKREKVVDIKSAPKRKRKK